VNDQLLDRLKHSAAIPSMPQVVCRFLDIVRDPVFSYEDLVDVLSTDPGLAGDVLRLANSSFFGINRRVTGLHQALALLGIRRVRSLVLGRHMVRALASKQRVCLRFNDYWRRSVATAVLTSKFAARRAPEWAEEAMIAGLLSDVGVIVLAECFAQEYAPVAEHYLTDAPDAYARRERNTLDTDHREAGALVLEEWELPPSIIEAVRNRYAASGEEQPAAAGNRPRLARLLSGAGLVSWILCQMPGRHSAVPVCLEAAELMDTDLSTLLEALDEAGLDVQELATLLQLQVLPLTGYEVICRELDAYISSQLGKPQPVAT
jgi:HD-like signal output (HDOD) protein